MLKMTWEEKTKMIQLSNKSKDKESRQGFLQYVVEHLETFDNQDYDMFITAFSLLSNEMKEDKEYHEKIYPKIKNLDDEKIGFRSAMRFEMYKMLCEGDLNITLY